MIDLPAILKSSVTVFRDNYSLALPTVISVFAVSFVSLAVVKSPEDTAGLLAMGLVSMIVSFFAHGVTLTMAAEALGKGGTSLLGGARLAARMMPWMLTVSVILGIMIGLGAMLFLLPGIAASFAFMFALPALVAEGAGPLAALRKSLALVRGNLRESLNLFLVMMTGGLLLGLINMGLNQIRVVGQLAGVAMSGVFGGYAAVVLMKSYAVLRKGAEQEESQEKAPEEAPVETEASHDEEGPEA